MLSVQSFNFEPYRLSLFWNLLHEQFDFLLNSLQPWNYKNIIYAKFEEIDMLEMKTWMLLTWATKASAKAISLQHGIRQIQAMAPTTRDQRCNFVGCQVPGSWNWMAIGSICRLLPIHICIEIYLYIHINVSMYIDMYEYMCITHLHVCMTYMFYDICIM